ncbi:NAD-dependent epimerase/dehydratase family protein [Bradyrhizobium sp. USDA 4504]
MARYIITGGSGFVGQALAKAIRMDGDEVIIASRGRHHDGGGEGWIEYDLRDRATIANLIAARPDGIYHLAWSTTPSSAEADAAADVQTNLGGTVELFRELAEKLDVPVLFLSSGGTVYGVAEQLPIPETHPLRPIGLYGMTKASAENYAVYFRERHGLDIRIARLANPFGATQSMAKLQGAASIFARKILHQEPITIWGDGSVVRDYIDVDDAVSGMKAIMKLNAAKAFPNALNIGSGEGTSLNQLIEIIGSAAGVIPRVSREAARAFDTPVNILDISTIRTVTGWHPRHSTSLALHNMISALMNPSPT